MEISGLDKVVMQEETDVAMMLKIASVRAVLGIIHLAWTLSGVVKKTELEAFTTVMMWHVSSRHYPTLIQILLEFVFRGSLRGIAPGCNRPGQRVIPTKGRLFCWSCL